MSRMWVKDLTPVGTVDERGEGAVCSISTLFAFLKEPVYMSTRKTAKAFKSCKVLLVTYLKYYYF